MGQITARRHARGPRPEPTTAPSRRTQRDGSVALAALANADAAERLSLARGFELGDGRAARRWNKALARSIAGSHLLGPRATARANARRVADSCGGIETDLHQQVAQIQRGPWRVSASGPASCRRQLRPARSADRDGRRRRPASQPESPPALRARIAQLHADYTQAFQSDAKATIADSRRRGRISPGATRSSPAPMPRPRRAHNWKSVRFRRSATTLRADGCPNRP